MRQQDRKEFAAILVGFSELKGKELSRAAMDMFWSAMQHWSIEDFREAANHLIRTCEFMPTPKDFEDLRGETTTDAWLRARDAVEYTPHGYVIKPGADPSLAATIRAIGGPNVLMLTSDDKVGFVHKRFVEAYREVDDAGAREIHHRLVATARKLVGGSDRQAEATDRRLAHQGKVGD